MSYDVVVRNGRVVLPAQGVGEADVAIAGGTIAALSAARGAQRER